MKNRLKELRKQHQWSQADLARALSVSRQAVNGFESSKFDPSLDMAFKIASLFNVTIEDVFMYEEKHSMQALVERVKNFLGFDFGFERFNEEAIRVITFAQHEAARLARSQVEPKHLLAGLLADPETPSAQLLRASGATLKVSTDKHSFSSSENRKFSPQGKFVLELALQVVRLQGKRSIETEHLLWGLVQLANVDETVLTDLFQHHEINLELLNNRLAEIV
jgi:putative transcriptional regulator